MNEVIPQIDFGIDFHTGGAKINNYFAQRVLENAGKEQPGASSTTAPAAPAEKPAEKK